MKVFKTDNNDNRLVANLELYNWNELNKKYNINALNELEFLFLFLEKFDIEKIDELKGGYAFAYHQKDKIILMRDVIGIKPICYNENQEYSTCLNDIKNAVELNPRRYIIFESNKLNIFKRRKYYSIQTSEDSYEIVKKRVIDLFISSIKKRIPQNKKIGLLFSGGTDSTLIALILKRLDIDFVCYTSSIKGGNIEEGVDILYARKIANMYDFKWELCELEFERVEEVTKNIINIIDDRKYTKICVALPLFIALKKAREDGVEIMFTGIGSEEVFADYKRDEDIDDINEICLEGLKSLWIRDLYRDYMLADSCNIELKFPFLDDDFINYSIKINPDFKIDKINKINKVILRDLLRDLGLSEEMVSRPKKAAQYGSKSDRIYEKLSKLKKIKKQEYLDEL